MSIKRKLPPCCFTFIFIGSKGSGKIYSVETWKLLTNYQKYPIYDADGNKIRMRVIVFCPIINSSANSIYKSLKRLDENDIILDY